MLAIIVPVLGRPNNAAPLAQSIAENTTVAHRIVWVVSPGDDLQRQACLDHGDVIETTWEPGRADFAKKVNLAYRLTTEPWIFQAADDLRFHPGWDTAAMEVAEASGAQVIGTNDLHNPVVKAGTHSTHTFIHRTYIDNPGASLDGPGSVFSEAYSHQNVDNELVEVAKIRGEWAFSPGSHVEHRHPFWIDRRLMDDTYRKGLKEWRQDGMLFRRRMRNVVRVSQR